MIGLHLDPALTFAAKRGTLRFLYEWCLPTEVGLTVMLGDWNCTEINDYEMMRVGGAIHHSRSLAAWSRSYATEAVEVPGEESTRWQMRDGRIEQVATLAWAYCVAHEPDVMSLRPNLSHPFSVTDLRVPSDHAPILLRFGRQRRGFSRLRVTYHNFDREDFGPRVWEVFDAERGEAASPSDALEHLKSCVQYVVHLISAELRDAPPIAGKLAAGMRLWRVVRRRDMTTVERTVALLPEALHAHGLAVGGRFC